MKYRQSKDIIEDLWKTIEMDYAGQSPDELAKEREVFKHWGGTDQTEPKNKFYFQDLPLYSEEEVHAAHKEGEISAREAQVLIQKLGLFGVPKMTLKMIGEEQRVSSSRIWKIKERAFEKMGVVGK